MPTIANAIALADAAADSKGTKYNVFSNRWTNIALQQGLYGISVEDAGGVIYIADNPQGIGALRVTKDFQIETSGRTTLYVKGQNEFDIKITQLEASLAGKADRANTYTMAQVDALLQGKFGDLAEGGVHFKDILLNEEALKDKEADAVPGDLYMIEDTGEFWIYTIEGFKKVGANILNLDDYYTKNEIEVKLANKADNAEFLIVKAKLEALIDLGGGFTYTQEGEPPLGVEAQEGDTWFKPSIPMIYVAKKDQANKLFWFSLGDQLKIDFTPEFISLKADQDVNGIKNFITLPTSPKTPVTPNELTTKNYVDSLVQSQLSDKLVTIDTNQTISGIKTFTGTPKLNSNVLDPSDITNKAYVDNAIQNAAINGGQGGNVDLNKYVTIDTAQTITATKIFTANQTLINPPATATDAANKGYVDTAIEEALKDYTPGGGGGQDVDLSNYYTKTESDSRYVDLLTTQTITSSKIFNVTPTIVNNPNLASDAVNKNYVDTQLTPINTKLGTLGQDVENLLDLSNEYAKKNEANTFTQKNTFKQGASSSVAPASNNDLVNKKYVDDIKADLQDKIDDAATGGDIDLTGYAKLSSDNTFTQNNTFNGKVQLNVMPQDEWEAVNKKYVDEQGFVTLYDNNAWAGENYFQQNAFINQTADEIDNATNDKAIPNLEYLKERYVDRSTNQEVRGLKEFINTLPKSYNIPDDPQNLPDDFDKNITPQDDTELTPKKYVDDMVNSVKELFTKFMEFQGSLDDVSALADLKDTSKNGDVYFITDSETFYCFFGDDFYPMGNGGSSGGGDFVDLTSDQNIGGVKTFVDTPKCSKDLTDVEYNTIDDEEILTKGSYEILNNIAVKDNGLPVWTDDEYNQANKAENKLYPIEFDGEFLNIIPTPLGEMVWTEDDYNNLPTKDNGFYFIYEE